MIVFCQRKVNEIHINIIKIGSHFFNHLYLIKTLCCFVFCKILCAASLMETEIIYKKYVWKSYNSILYFLIASGYLYYSFSFVVYNLF